MRAVEILSALGERLRALAEDGGDSALIRHAVDANPWFSAHDIRRSAATFATDMLSHEACTEWLARYPTLPVAPSEARNIAVIMAGNLPLVGLHDLACVVAAGHRAWVKPSSKDAVLLSWVVEQLLAIDPTLPVAFLDENSPSPDAVIAMGGDEAVEAIRQRFAGAKMLLRGHRSSLAILDGGETRAQLDALADDVLAYSGRGCRSVSLVFMPHGYDFSALREALSRRSNPAENGLPLNLKYRNNYRQARALAVIDGTAHIDAEACLMVENSDFPTRLSLLHYAFYDSPAEVVQWLNERNTQVQCVACRHPAQADYARAVPLGHTQRPTLGDYPDGVDVMQFLADL